MTTKHFRAQLKRLLKKHPTLCPRGFSDVSPEGSLLDDPYPAQVDAAITYIRDNWHRIKNVRKKGSTSYSYKHVAERWLAERRIYGEGICNGALIAAALLLGYKVERESPCSPNAYFNIGRRSVPKLKAPLPVRAFRAQAISPRTR